MRYAPLQYVTGDLNSFVPRTGDFSAATLDEKGTLPCSVRHFSYLYPKSHPGLLSAGRGINFFLHTDVLESGMDTCLSNCMQERDTSDEQGLNPIEGIVIVSCCCQCTSAKRVFPWWMNPIIRTHKKHR